MITASIHDVTKLEVTPVTSRCHDDLPEYYRRSIKMVKDGVTIEFTLFANTPDALYLPGEIYPEREIALPAAAAVPAEAEMAGVSL